MSTEIVERNCMSTNLESKFGSLNISLLEYDKYQKQTGTCELLQSWILGVDKLAVPVTIGAPVKQSSSAENKCLDFCIIESS